MKKNTVPFVVIDGQDGSGKGTQIKLLVERAEREGRNIHPTREPGGARLSEMIREVFVSPEGAEASPRTQFLLMWAARANWLEKVVIPSLERGIPVLADRCDSSTLAYQIYAKEGRDLETWFWEMRGRIFGTYTPTRYLIIDVPAEEAKRRVDADVSREKSRFDMKPLDFYERVRKGFARFAEMPDDGVTIINGMRDPEVIHEEVYAIVSKLCGWQ